MMQKYQDTATGDEWHFDADVEVADLPNVPHTLTQTIIPRPSENHDWNGAGWTLNAARNKEAHNENIKAQIATIEIAQVRPTRELLIDAANTFAKNKMLDMDAQISALRAQLL